MRIAMIGLGRMGGNMARRLRCAGHEVVGYDVRHTVATSLAESCGLEAADSLQDAVARLPAPRLLWLMLPAGKEPTAGVLQELKGLLAAGDLVVDGGNAHYRESQARAEELRDRGMDYMDVGVSGGLWGLDNGYTLMVGGESAAVARMTPILQALAPAADCGWLHCGPSGSGHFVKMVHNGIEYGLMQAYAEGFALMRGKTEFNLDLAAVAEMLRHGSVIRGWLLDLTAGFLKADQRLDEVAPYVADSGEGRWMVMEAMEQGIPAPVTALALMTRFDSQDNGNFRNRMMARMRQAFGGHAIKKTGEQTIP